MAEKEDAMKIEHNGKSFDEDPLEYCKSIYLESSKRVDQLFDINVENQEFYEGIDPVLEDRKSDTRVQRAALFVHQLTPAIDTRIGDMIATLEQDEFPVVVRPANDAATTEEFNQAKQIQVKLNRQLRDCGYLSDTFEEQVLASEIFRTPSVVKVGWRNTTVRKPSVRETAAPQSPVEAIGSYEIPGREVTWDFLSVGAPYVDFMRPEEFLYQPAVSRFSDCEYAGHRMRKTKWEIMSMVKEFGWDEKKANRYFEDYETSEGDEGAHSGDTILEEVQADSGTPFDFSVDDCGRHLLVEWYITSYRDDGSEVVNQVVVLGNREILSNKPSRYKGIGRPFFMVTANRQIGSIENLSSIDKGKQMQRVYNEAFNSFLDGVTYRTFPPFLVRQGNSADGQPVWGPGRLIYMNDISPDAFRPAVENPGMMPDLPALMEAIAAKIRDTLNAQDIAQGFQAKQYEKATSTKLRAYGAARRSMPTRKKYGMVLIDVAKAVIALNQQFAEDGADWVMDVVVDVPTLTSVSDPDSDKEDALLLYTQMLQDPLFASPNGMRKRRNAWENVVRKFNKTNVERFVPSEDELNQDIQIQTNLQTNQMDQQQIMTQLGMAAQSMASAGGQNGV